MSEPIHIISLGAGVQSSTMALMAAAGEITPMPNSAVFADTTYEPKAVYQWLDWLEKNLPFPVYRVTARDNRRKIVSFGQSQIPTHVEKGFGKRQCTSNWKIVPLQREWRRILGYTGRRVPNDSMISWIGISLDEVHRMKPTRENWVKNRWPLIENRLSRNDCLRWMERNGFPRPPRSACIFCPYKNDADWRETYKDPEQMRFAREVEAMLPAGEFLHYTKKKLDDVDWSTDEDRGQLSLFGNECEGMCGV